MLGLEPIGLSELPCPSPSWLGWPHCRLPSVPSTTLPGPVLRAVPQGLSILHGYFFS